ncbi:hypothetical protein HYPSUDRAFT_198197 [Hypholoma sublateritium FD-334 SS-4]|uniref:Uncharacterized protein n=1 Tax=Hypholoma sublateritium (strain FD-334 SS-4) TaxID=945553 RepID=A0A0D2PFT5_HYPSF|nr:hypothetical protein HYPSUDRAFT_198197 [Hypholoma sublateritium FD-334 SS-4]
MRRHKFGAFPKSVGDKAPGETEPAAEDDEEDEPDAQGSPSDFNHLLGMVIWGLTKEKIAHLKLQAEEREAGLLGQEKECIEFDEKASKGAKGTKQSCARANRLDGAATLKRKAVEAPKKAAPAPAKAKAGAKDPAGLGISHQARGGGICLPGHADYRVGQPQQHVQRRWLCRQDPVVGPAHG